jgi:hypothetical protein
MGENNHRHSTMGDSQNPLPAPVVASLPLPTGLSHQSTPIISRENELDMIIRQL